MRRFTWQEIIFDFGFGAGPSNAGFCRVKGLITHQSVLHFWVQVRRLRFGFAEVLTRIVSGTFECHSGLFHQPELDYVISVPVLPSRLIFDGFEDRVP